MNRNTRPEEVEAVLGAALVVSTRSSVEPEVWNRLVEKVSQFLDRGYSIADLVNATTKSGGNKVGLETTEAYEQFVRQDPPKFGEDLAYTIAYLQQVAELNSEWTKDFEKMSDWSNEDNS